MKKNIATIFLFLMSYAYTAKAQNITFTEGPELERGVGTGKEYVIGEDENSFYILRSNAVGKFARWVEKFNKKTLNNEYSVNVELLEDKEYYYDGYNSLMFELIKGEIVIFFDIFNKGEKKKFLFQKTIGKNGALSARKELGSVPCTPYGVQNSKYSCIFTKDKSKLLIQLKIYKKEIEGDQTLSFFDYPSMKNIWIKNSPLDFKGSDMFFSVDSVINDGTSYVSFSTGKQDDDTYQRYTALIKSGNNTLSDVKEVKGYVYSDDSKYRFSSEEITAKNGKIIRAGLYFEKVAEYDKKNPPNLKMGTYMSYVDPITNKITLENYSLFPSDVSDKLTYKIKVFDKQSLYPSDKPITTQEVIEMNGNVFVICENSYTVSVSSSSGGGESYANNRELIVSKFDASGKPEWTKIIPKFTVNSGDYNVIAYNGKLHFFYLENEKNEQFDINNYTVKDDYEDGRLKKANTVCTTIEANGAMSKQLLLKPIKDQFYYCPSWKGVKIGDNSLIVHYQFGISNTSNTKLGLITVK